MLPKRSHSIIWFTVKSTKRTLGPSGLTSELHYFSSQRDVYVVIIGCCDKMDQGPDTLFEWQNLFDTD